MIEPAFVPVRERWDEMNKGRRITMTFLLLGSFLFPGAAASADTENEKIASAVHVLEQIMTIPEKGIPPQLLENAQGVAVIPGVIKVGFVVGGRHGTGILMVRRPEGGWSAPSFISLTGGSIGWQIGAQSTDVILVFKNPRSIEGILKGKFTLGGDAAVAAGPVGRRVEGATDAQLQAEIYSYSRSRGLFAGVSLEGSALQIKNEANAEYYGKGVEAEEIFSGRVSPSSSEVKQLQRILGKYAGN